MTHLVINEGGEGQVVKQVGKESPHISVAVFSQAFIVEAVHLGDLPRLVVSSQNGDPISIAKFHCDEESDSLDGVIPAINIVAHEEIVGIGGITADTKEFRKVVLMDKVNDERGLEKTVAHKLTMYITTDSDGAPHWLDIGLVHQDFPGLCGSC